MLNQTTTPDAEIMNAYVQVQATKQRIQVADLNSSAADQRQLVRDYLEAIGTWVGSFGPVVKAVVEIAA
jgi:hypothetical protein